jgi:hypothetical protein
MASRDNDDTETEDIDAWCWPTSCQMRVAKRVVEEVAASQIQLQTGRSAKNQSTWDNPQDVGASALSDSLVLGKLYTSCAFNMID